MSSVEFTRDQNSEFLIYPPPGFYYDKQVSQPSFSSKISPAVLLIIVILAAIFFISGLLHLLIRFLTKRPSSSIYQSDRFRDNSGSHVLQRQLQQLFRLHDSGLDQAFIDALPVFYYKDIIGLKEPFDCAVCLSEFLEHDKLRLLPLCGHAFHIQCIDTWLLSSSTCPLCRGTLANSGFSVEKPILSLDNSFLGDVEHGLPTKSVMMEDTEGERVMFSVRLGKFRSLNAGNESEGLREGEGSSCNLDARRCYSMGSYQYVEGKFDLQVALSSSAGGFGGSGGGDGGGVKITKLRIQNPACSSNGDDEGKKISGRSRGESFSVSKIWLWSKNSKLSSSLESRMELPQCNSRLQNADTFQARLF